MDSGLGSDEDRRGRTKEQKQLRNQQLLSGCFIDAASLSDDAEVAEQRRNDERRQGALIFQSSIPQFSMLQMSGSENGRGSSPGPPEEDPDTPYNSIVQLDEQEPVRKSPLGFYVDLSEVAEPPRAPPQTAHKKNIFSMVIDFEAPKKGKPAKLSSSALCLKKIKHTNKINGTSSGSASLSSSTSCIAGGCDDDPGPSASRGPLMTTQSMIDVPLSSEKPVEVVANISESSSLTSCVNGLYGSPRFENEENRCPDKSETKINKVEFCEPSRTDDEEERVKEKEDRSNGNIQEADHEQIHHAGQQHPHQEHHQQQEQQQFVKLSDLEWQRPRTELGLPARMSRSIPESSWVESPLLMSRSAGYRSAPHPLEPDGEEDDEDEEEQLEESEELVGLGEGPRVGRSRPRRAVRQLGTDLLRMFLEEIGPDVTVEVEGRRLRAHKCILASRCQYFAALLSGNWLENSGNVVSLHGFSYEAVYFALCHVYSGAAHVPDSISLVELASLADMLGLEGLKEVVEHALKQRHCHNFHKPCPGCCTGVLEVLPLAAAYGLDDLYRRCLHWITQHFVRVWPSRAFASLPRELRDKCYQQHVVHMTPDRVLDTAANCDKILGLLPTAARWAEPVGQLSAQLADACHLYLRQHFAQVLQAPSFLRLDAGGVCWDGPAAVEERVLAAARNLSVEQGCRSYARVCRHLEKSWGRPFADFLNRLKVLLEQGLVAQSDRLIRSNAWLRMDSHLRARIKELTPTTEPVSRLPRATPKRVKAAPGQAMAASLSSSDSSRNSSPGINQSQAGHSPSLRRSLLLAARAPQVPPSPAATRRGAPPAVPASPSAHRRSTLTQPTQSSAAKSAPSRNVRQPRPVPPRTTPARTVQQRRPQPTLSASVRKEPVVAVHVQKKEPKKEPVRKQEPIIKKPPSRCGSPLKTDSRASSPRKLDSRVNSPIKERRPMSAKKSPPAKKSPGGKQKAVPVDPPPVMQRSSTFLKEEPTILAKIK